MNKKVIIPLFATVLGLSAVGGISGTVAWYQYNTRATASFVGTSVADSGVLQIKTSTEDWRRDVYATESTNSNKLIPVTFGNEGNAKNAALPDNAYKRPEAGVEKTEDWEVAVAKQDYIQYKVELRALKAKQSENEGYEQVALPVYLSDIHLGGHEDNITNSKIEEALRIHLDVKDGGKFLISNAGGTTNLWAEEGLDLDRSGAADTKGGYDWEKGSNPVLKYGALNKTQESYSIAEMECPRNSQTKELTNTSADTLICTTKTGTDTVEITITVWLEGWEILGSDADAIWNPHFTQGAKVDVGLTFDVGPNAFNE